MPRSEMVHYGPWQIPLCVKHALCSDGVRRYAQITGQPDTYFSVPASVQVSRDGIRYTVTGFISSREVSDGTDYYFIASSNGKNGHLLPGRVTEEME